MPLAVTPLYASILALIYVVLSARVIGYRRNAGISLGDGGDRVLLRRQRVHSNFAEYAPLALLLLGFAELNGAAALPLHGLGLTLLAGRTAHAIGMSRRPGIPALRVGGMALTFVVIISAAVLNLGMVAAGR